MGSVLVLHVENDKGLIIAQRLPVMGETTATR
jgi:hypothetical protein